VYTIVNKFCRSFRKGEVWCIVQGDRCVFDVCWRMLVYADVCWRKQVYRTGWLLCVRRMLTYASVCWRMLTYADVCVCIVRGDRYVFDVCWRMLVYSFWVINTTQTMKTGQNEKRASGSLWFSWPDLSMILKNASPNKSFSIRGVYGPRKTPQTCVYMRVRSVCMREVNAGVNTTFVELYTW
jgi:hypothetical protein